jgi:type I restriction-modification system DNA methylase subunit
MIPFNQPTKTQVEQAFSNLDRDTLLDLFYTHLNYDRASQLISTRQWDTNIQQSIADTAPTVIASAAGGAFQIIYTRLNSDNLNNKQEQRKIIEKLLLDRPYSLFIFTNLNQSQWHFVNVKQQSSNQRQRLFRRIAITKGEVNRTAIEQISELDLKRFGDDLAIISPLKIQQQHDRAFDVEQVTKKFFTEYSRVFKQVESSIEGIPNPEHQRLFNQKLFNRLMFIAFIQKKGWLKFGESIDYLNALWQDYKQSERQTGNFYRDRLSHLFFSGLNDRQQPDLTGLIGTVPYLNGGLFQQSEDEQDEIIFMPDLSFELIFTELFDRFNFTVTESTPLDEEVAVDPEMLGKVFEELVTGRHDSGSYYTPKPIVSFMCREAIKGYLSSKASAAAGEISKFVDERDASTLSDPELIFKALKEVTVCDPACGSGAYLLGMLHELLELRECLFTSKNLGFQTIYERKLEIIENNLYGVDKELFAVSIARLRLWLSLAVDFEGETPNPLPNLNYKLEVGDSLLAPSPQAGEITARSNLLVQYRERKAEYVRTHDRDRKRELESQIGALKQDIGIFTHGNDRINGFDWAVEFAEVMAEGGFDIQIANPPYVRHERIQEFKPQLKQVYPEIYSSTGDLYCYFYARSLQLLKPGGMLAFISSNKWFRANYGKKLRQHIADTCQIHSITDFGELPVFKSAATFPMIFICSRESANAGATIFTQVKSLEHPYPNVREIIQHSGTTLPRNAIVGSNWLLTDNATASRIAQMESVGVALGKYVNGEIYYGIKTGFNQAFIIDHQTHDKLIFADPASEEIIKPLVTGDDVRKWQLRDRGKWLIVAKTGIDISKYPSILNHLQQWQPQLEKRCDKGNHWWELRACAYYAALDRSKIIFPDIAKESRFTFDPDGKYLGNTAYFIPTEDLYLLGVLNSSSVWSFCKEKCSVNGDAGNNGRLRLFKQFVETIPIPSASKAQQKAISKLVQKCLTAKGVGCEQLDREIDLRVAKLYGFDQNQG